MAGDLVSPSAKVIASSGSSGFAHRSPRLQLEPSMTKALLQRIIVNWADAPVLLTQTPLSPPSQAGTRRLPRARPPVPDGQAAADKPVLALHGRQALAVRTLRFATVIVLRT